MVERGRELQRLLLQAHLDLRVEREYGAVERLSGTGAGFDAARVWRGAGLRRGACATLLFGGSGLVGVEVLEVIAFRSRLCPTPGRAPPAPWCRRHRRCRPGTPMNHRALATPAALPVGHGM